MRIILDHVLPLIFDKQVVGQLRRICNKVKDEIKRVRRSKRIIAARVDK